MLRPIIWIVVLALSRAGMAQSSGTGSISGRVVSDDGHTVHAIVSLQFAAARGFPSATRRVFTDNNGSFTFTRLPAAKYTLCAQVPELESAHPATTPFLDTCVWGSNEAAISVSTGQAVAGIVFTAPKGSWLQFRVNDPDQVLPQLAAAAPAPLEPELQLIVRGADRRYRHAQFVSKDAAGRNYQMVVPLNTALWLTVYSSVAGASDQNNAAVHSESALPVSAVALAPMTFTLHPSGH